MPLGIRVENSERIREAVASQLDHVRELLALPLAEIALQGPTGGAKHPLLEVLQATETWLAIPDLATAPLEGYMIEASGLGPLLDARHDDPALDELVRGMVVPEQYLHAVGVLGVAYAMGTLPDVERVGLLRKTSSAPGRIADLSVEFRGGRGFQVEVKAPRALRNLTGTLRARIARRIVINAVSSASAPEDGQLLASSPGLVSVASRGLTPQHHEVLGRSAGVFLERVGAACPSLMGVLFVDFYRAAHWVDKGEHDNGDGTTTTRREVNLTFGSHRNYRANPGYRGGVQLKVEEGHERAKNVFDLRATSTSTQGEAGIFTSNDPTLTPHTDRG